MTESRTHPDEKKLTGRHVAMITVSAFAVIISVNVFMAIKAVKTFPGLEVKNSYVASQTFDVERTAQEALGWKINASDVDGKLFVSITDADGVAVEAQTIVGTLGRATHTQQDQTPDFVFNGTSYVAETGALALGNWNLRMEATAKDGTHFKQRVIIHVTR
jgi:nitrogen fixation protein FixH